LAHVFLREKFSYDLSANIGQPEIASAGRIFGAAALAQIGQITAIEIPTCKTRFTIFSAALILSLA
jgi:hypothetical protein